MNLVNGTFEKVNEPLNFPNTDTEIISPPAPTLGLSFPIREIRVSGLTGDPHVYLIRASNPYAQVAQSVEQRTENPRVGGSIPPLGTIKFLLNQLFTQLPIALKTAVFKKVDV